MKGLMVQIRIIGLDGNQKKVRSEKDSVRGAFYLHGKPSGPYMHGKKKFLKKIRKEKKSVYLEQESQFKKSYVFEIE